MTQGALKLTDFSLDDGASISAMSQSLAFNPVEVEENCESCRVASAELQALAARQADDLTSQIEDIQSRFDGELEKLQMDLAARLRVGLNQCLTALFPSLAQASLRKALEVEISQSLTDTLPESLSVKISSDVSDIIDVPNGITLTQDSNLTGHIVEIQQGEARTRLDPDVILNRCLALLNSDISNEIPK